MTVAAFFPWHQQIAADWLGHRDRFAHAWLIHGLAGIGKREFAFAAAASLLCEAPVKGLACGKCLACGWVSLGNHPDLKRIRPEAMAVEEGAEQESEEGVASEAAAEPGASTKRAPSKDIRVEQIRVLEPWFNNATHRGGWRVALIYPAESLNAISANALLKVLEEPPPNTVFLLVADAPDRLLPTLLSRCRRLPLPTPALGVAQAWLAEQGVASAAAWLAASGGAPVLARKQSLQQSSACPEWLSSLLGAVGKGVAPDIGSVADTLAKLPAAGWLDPLQRVAVDLVLVANGLAARYFPSMQAQLATMAAPARARALAELASWLNDQRRVAGHPLNAKLFAHAVLQRVVSTCMPIRTTAGG